MSDKKNYLCKECGEILHLTNWRTETNPDGTDAKFVDAWCVNDECSKKNILGVIDLTPRG